MASKSIALIGMPGAGKSTVGKLLAERLRLPFTDTDLAVEQAAGLTVAEIFAREGEEGFRKRETAALAAAVASPGVLSCGGGIVLRAENVRLLKAHCFVVYLQASARTLCARVHGGEGRPLLEGDYASNLRKLLCARESLYAAAADATVPSDGLTAEQTVTVLRKLVGSEKGEKLWN